MGLMEPVSPAQLESHIVEKILIIAYRENIGCQSRLKELKTPRVAEDPRI
jgi:hypothetical protein